MARDTGARPLEGTALCGVSNALFGLGEYEGAAAHAEQALAILRTTGDREFQVYALMILGHSRVELGRLDDAAGSYASALAISRELGLLDMATAPQAPLASVALARGDLGQALGYVEAILGHVAAGGSMDASFELLRIQYTCYQVLAAAHDTRADALLGTARTMLEERAARFTDPQARRRFENITQHREIANAWRFAGFKSS